MDYQILVLDLDGTLTNSKKEITQPTLEALIEIQEAGKKVVLASGRPTQGVMPLAEQLHLEDYGSYILSFNGGRITDCRTKQAIYNKILPADCIPRNISYPVLNPTNIQNSNPASIRCLSLTQVRTFWTAFRMIRINFL